MNFQFPPRILIVGDSMLDRYWEGDVYRISPEAPVPIVQFGRQIDRLGGAANVARNAKALGAAVGLLGVLGDDDVGRIFREQLELHQIQDHMRISTEIQSTAKLRVVCRGQQLIRVDFEDHLQATEAKILLQDFPQILGDNSCVIFSDYNKGALLCIAEMIVITKGLQRIAIVDPKGADFKKYKGADIITPNQAELMGVMGRWTDEEDLSRKAFEFAESIGVANLLLTRSEQGMSLFGNVGGARKRYDFEAETHDVFDVTGAGDTAIATLGVMLARGAALPDAVQMANRAAGIVVEKFGTSVVTMSELLQRAKYEEIQ